MRDRVIAVGELLIDFICSDRGSAIKDGVNFVKKAGGAPGNVCACISKLGGDSAFIGKVGNEPFGEFLIDVLKDTGVETRYIVKDQKNHTSQAFVSLMEDGERDFVFNRGADSELSTSEINIDEILKERIFHFGSATALLGGKLRDSYFEVFKIAVDEGKFVSFDPNFRSDLWKGREREFVHESIKYISKSDLIKVSQEELHLISGIEDMNEALTYIHGLGAGIICVTLGKDGTLVSTHVNRKVVGSITIKSIDSTGAGDAFIGALLYKVSEMENKKGLADDFETLEKFVSFANKVGAVVCTKLGAISSLPYLEEVESMEG